MDTLTLNVYGGDGQVVKTAEARMLDLEFGTIRSLMELLNIQNMEDTVDLLRILYSAWEDVVKVLGKCFPELTYEDWEHVKLRELVPLVAGILRYSFAEMLAVPRDPKN